MRAMRVIAVAAAGAVTAMSMMPAKSPASELFYKKRLQPTATLPSLGPAGDGRRKWVEFQCYICHGSNGAGQIGPNVQHAEIGDLTEAVKQGVPEWGMPAYGGAASSADINNLAAYLASVGTPNEPKWWDWWLPHPKQ